MTEFLAMGGYAAYVWPSYLIVLLVLAYNILAPWQRDRRLRRRLAARFRAQGAAR